MTWLTPNGALTTVVKGAVRAKSAFLGQYDLNYTCDILYYARARGGLHALRDCVPIRLREELRTNYRALALASYFRRLVGDLAPTGPDCQAWYDLLNRSLSPSALVPHPSSLLVFELEVLRLSGLEPDFSGYDPDAEWSALSVESGSFAPSDGRIVRVSRQVAEYLCNPRKNVENRQIPLDAARVIGVFYAFHLDCASDVRRMVLGMIS